MNSDMETRAISPEKRAWQPPRVIESEILIRDTKGGGKNDRVADGGFSHTS